MIEPNLTTPTLAAGSPWPEAMDPDAIVAQIISALTTKGLAGTADAFNALAQLNADLQDRPTEVILKTLSRQAALLEVLTLANTCDAVQAQKPDHKALFTQTALKCQKAHLGVLSAIHKLHQDRRDVQAIGTD